MGCLDPSSFQEPRVLFYPGLAVSAIAAGQAGGGEDGGGEGGGVGVPAGMVAVGAPWRFPGRGVPDGTGLDSALTLAGGGGLASGEVALFCQPVTAAPVLVRRDGRVQARGHLAEHARLGLLEEHLPEGAIEELVARRGVGEQRLRAISAGMAARCVLAMTLMPLGLREVMATVAGQLAFVPWVKPWRVPGGEVLCRWRRRLGEGLFTDLFWVAAERGAAEPEHTGPHTQARGWLDGLLVCSVDGTQIRCPDTQANREAFGSSGTADDSAPYPQARAVLVSASASRAVLAAAVDGSGVGEQRLITRIADEHPEVFAPGRVFLFDRNFLGGELIAKILAAGAHVLMRVKSDITLPNLGWRRDGSYDSHLHGPQGPIPVRVAEYDVAAPDDAEAPEELYCLVTDLRDDEKYPAQALAAAYPQRWIGSETTIKENKTTITDAGPSRGPIFRSTTPDMVRQEFWAWLTATNLLRAEARRAARHATGPARPRPARPTRHVPARQVSFTATARETIRSLTLSTHTATTTTAARSLAATRTATALLPQLIQLDRNRHRPRVTKCRQQFPSAKRHTPTHRWAGQIIIRAPHPLPDTG